MSSQHIYENNRDIIDIGLLRSSAITSNHVYYMCLPHLKKLSSMGITSPLCLCHIFTQPMHIMSQKSFQNITELFTKSKNEDENDQINLNHSLLLELGIDMNLINDDIKAISNQNLCTKNARIHLQTNSISLKTLIKNQNDNCKVSNIVMVYIDPAPILGESSLNAMCFVTRVTLKTGKENSYKYIIVALENFRSDRFDPDTHSYQLATARILMKDICDIFAVYNGHFKEFIIAPEADSLPMEGFLLECQNIMKDNKFMCAQNAPRIFFTTIKICFSKKKKLDFVENKNDDPSLASSTTIDLSPDRSNGTQIFPSLPMKRKHMYDSLENNPFLLPNMSSETEYVNYRIGYNLGYNKMQMYLDFILKQYNALNIFCASEVFGHTFSSSNMSIPTCIADSLDALIIKSKGNSKWQITGKRRKNGKLLRDDITDTVVMGVMLFPLAAGEDPKSNPLYELKCRY